MHSIKAISNYSPKIHNLTISILLKSSIVCVQLREKILRYGVLSYRQQLHPISDIYWEPRPQSVSQVTTQSHSEYSWPMIIASRHEATRRFVAPRDIWVVCLLAAIFSIAIVRFILAWFALVAIALVSVIQEMPCLKFTFKWRIVRLNSLI